MKSELLFSGPWPRSAQLRRQRRVPRPRRHPTPKELQRPTLILAPIPEEDPTPPPVMSCVGAAKRGQTDGWQALGHASFFPTTIHHRYSCCSCYPCAPIRAKKVFRLWASCPKEIKASTTAADPHVRRSKKSISMEIQDISNFIFMDFGLWVMLIINRVCIYTHSQLVTCRKFFSYYAIKNHKEHFRFGIYISQNLQMFSLAYLIQDVNAY